MLIEGHSIAERLGDMIIRRERQDTGVKSSDRRDSIKYSNEFDRHVTRESLFVRGAVRSSKHGSQKYAAPSDYGSRRWW